MFNESALKQLKNCQPKRSFDAIDEEAERQGNATGYFSRNELRPQLGKRISKDTRQLNGRRKTADNRATQNLVKDTAAAYRQYQAA